MSLLADFARTCVILKRTRRPDGSGGWLTDWDEGETFTARFALDSSIEARRAEREGVTSVYSVLVDQDAGVTYGDYFRDQQTKRAYRVTSHPCEKESPRSAGFSLKYFTAERKEPPDDEGSGTSGVV